MRGSLRNARRRRGWRHGATAVELALISPFLLLFLYMIFEISHLYAVQNSVRMACRLAAREGVVTGVTEAEVADRVRDVLSPFVHSTDNIVVAVKDASTYDAVDSDGNPIDFPAADSIQAAIWNLPDLTNLQEADLGQLYVVAARVPYDEVALLPGVIKGLANYIGSMYDNTGLAETSALDGIQLKSYSFMRHE